MTRGTDKRDEGKRRKVRSLPTPKKSSESNEPIEVVAEAAAAIARAKTPASPEGLPPYLLDMLLKQAPFLLKEKRALFRNMITNSLKRRRDALAMLALTDEELVRRFRSDLNETALSAANGIECEKKAIAWIEQRLRDPAYLAHWAEHDARIERRLIATARQYGVDEQEVLRVYREAGPQEGGAA